PWACTRSARRCSIPRCLKTWADWRGTPRTRNVSNEITATPRTPKTLWAWAVATFFGAGLLKPGPGTWGSVAALLLWAAFAMGAHPARLTLLLALIAGIVLSVAIGIPAATI